MGANAQRRRQAGVPTLPVAPSVTGATAQLTLPSGRPAMITVPVDITELEIIGLVNGVIQFGMELRAKRPGSRILLPQ